MSNIFSAIFNSIAAFFKNLFSLPKPQPDETPQSNQPETPTDKPDTNDSAQEDNTDETPAAGQSEKSSYIKIDPNYNLKKGFDSKFLTKPLELPKLSPGLKIKAVKVPNTSDNILNYYHYSLVMDKDRKMPFFTAVNINGASYEKLKSQIPSRKEIGTDKWYADPRIPTDDQLPKKFYDKNDFDLGHMVRREDALWGDTLEMALKANSDTFHLTNACPQHKDFNRNAKRWLGLENYALQNARKYGLKISVFSGPVMKDDDRQLNGVKIPAQFWKVIVMIKDDGTPSATGYIVHQEDLIQDVTTRGFTYEQFETYQVPLSEIEAATNLSFGLNEFDPLQKEGVRDLLFEPKKIGDFTEIQF